MVIGIPFKIFLFWQLYRSRLLFYISRNVKQLKKEFELELHIYSLIELIEFRD